MSEKKGVIRRVFESNAFDSELGSHKVMNIRFEYPENQFQTIQIPKADFDPETALKKVNDWIKKEGSLIGKKVG